VSLRGHSPEPRRSRLPWAASALALSLLCLALAGCAVLQVREESQDFYVSTVLVGRVAAPAGWQGSVVVVAVSESDSPRTLAHQVRLHEPGGYELIVPDGRYLLCAYADTNNDGSPDPEGPAALLDTPVAVANSGIVMLLDLTLAPGGAEVVRRTLPSPAPRPPVRSTQVGALADLSDPEFSAESGRKGYWKPMEFFRRTGGNVYFLEPYDPARRPVLLVHGAVGSAQDWKPFIDQLDRKRYQAWIFQYPSGSSLESMSHLLFWKLLNLQLRYRFEHLDLVGHSMGGLVLRRFLIDHGEQFPQLGAWVTLSTPWGGEPSASLGVKHSPGVVPSWRDLQPEGPFIQDLFKQPLPPGIRHLLLFGHRGGYSLIRPTTDGTVTLASQLRPEAQAGARLVMGFDEDHTSILASPAVFAQVMRFLEASGRSDAPGGRLAVSLALSDAGAGAATRPASDAGVPVLVLSARDAGGSATPPLLLPLTFDPAGTRLGPIPPGTYDAQLAAQGFRSEPARQAVTVTAGGLAPLAFQLAPQGVLAGYVGEEGDSLAYPAGSYRRPHASIRIRRIELRGPGGLRILTPRAGGSREILTSYLEGRDDAAGPHYSFVQLPEGEFELTILAVGHEPHVSRHQVTPGVVPPMTPIRLRPSN
jgi:uncharacterized alpha/beta hydrolase family protein